MSSPSQRASRVFESAPATVRAARQFVVEALDAAACEAEDAVLFTSELVSNAVHYAETEIEVVVLVDEATVRVEVHDGFSLTEAFRVLVETEQDIVEVDSKQIKGRGLLMVRGKASEFGVIDKGVAGKAVWFELATDL